jgi:hypothetical protein
MNRIVGRRHGVARLLGLLTASMVFAPVARAQFRQEPGRSIGTITTQGNLIVMTLNEGVLGRPNLFDLSHRTLRFTPDGERYRVENLPVRWDPEFGSPMTTSRAAISAFGFPFSGKKWNSFSVGVTGSMTFADAPVDGGRGGRGGGGFGGGGLFVDRFAELQEAGSTFINGVPAISVFFKPRMSGRRYFKELPDRAVVTWTLTEPMGGVQDMTWTPTVNRFQAVLHKNGTIELSYDDVHAEDAIVGVYPTVDKGAEQSLATIAADENTEVPPHLDIKTVKLSSVDHLFLKVSIETRGPLPAAGDPAMNGVSYRVCLDRDKPAGGCAQGAPTGTIWTIQGGRFAGGGGGGGGGRGAAAPRFFAFGTGVSADVTVEGNMISLRGTLSGDYKSGDQVFVSVVSQTPGNPPVAADQVQPHAVTLRGLSSPAVDFSSVKKSDGPYAAVYEAFHYMKPPRAVDLTCTVINALGDKFDMLAYYSDFRIDNPEAGTSSSGPLGGGPGGGAVTGIGANQRNLSSYCSQGRFQWQYIQPVYVGANQMAEYPPTGIVDSNTHNVLGYAHQLAERTSDGRIPPYDYAMSQIGHEMGHRWSAFVSAKVNGETIQLGPTHWARGLQAPAAFPYQRPVEASAMGGGVWQDNLDGTFTQLDDDYYVPATGWSYLDLYLMGLIAPSEVPDFFILRNLVAEGRDANGRPIFKADRTKVTIQDVIAVEGPRLPDVDHSQKEFNTGMVVVVEHGKTPSKELLDRTEGIRLRWMDYWTTTTGHRSTMTTNPR